MIFSRRITQPSGIFGELTNKWIFQTRPRKVRRIFSLILISVILIISTQGVTVANEERFKFTGINYERVIFDGEPFCEDLAAVIDDTGRVGYIDTAGNVAIPFVFDTARSFSQGLAPARIPNGKFGFINKEGKFVIAPTFDDALGFSDGLALVQKDDRWFYIDKTGGEVLITADSAIVPVTNFSSGRAWAEDKDGNAAVMGQDGKNVTDFCFKWYSGFSDGVAWTSKDRGEDFYHISMGLIDTNGNWLIEPGRFTDAREFHNGVCWATQVADSRKVLIDKTGQVLLRYAQEQVTDFDSEVCVTDANGGIVFIDKTDALLWSSKSYALCFRNAYGQGRAIVRRKADGKCFIIEDTLYTPMALQDLPAAQWTYAPQSAPEEQRIEICLKVGSPVAIVNNRWCYIDPEDTTLAPIVSEDERVLLPLRFVGQTVPGWEVGWDISRYDTAILYRGDKMIYLKMGDTQARILAYDHDLGWYKESFTQMTLPPMMLKGRTFLSIRSISEIMGNQVFWYDPGLIIITNDVTPPSKQRVDELLARYE